MMGVVNDAMAVLRNRAARGSMLLAPTLRLAPCLLSRLSAPLLSLHHLTATPRAAHCMRACGSSCCTLAPICAACIRQSDLSCFASLCIRCGGAYLCQGGPVCRGTGRQAARRGILHPASCIRPPCQRWRAGASDCPADQSPVPENSTTTRPRVVGPVQPVRPRPTQPRRCAARAEWDADRPTRVRSPKCATLAYFL